MWTYNTTYLSHHGIKGQKWGVRRYQNPDGSYTAAGRKKYGKLEESAEHKEYENIKKKDISEMSNAELRKANERYTLENNFRKNNPNAIAQGIKYVAIAAAAITTINNLFNNSDQLINRGKKGVDMLLGVINKLKR
jgi:hypothetical protein